MKIHTTNYQDTFIEVAEDCPVSVSEIPLQKNIRTIAEMQYEMISKHPYHFTSDDIIFETYAQKNNFTEIEKPEERLKFFSKGQPCLRSSALAKRYGFGIHHNNEGKVTLFSLESQEYKNFISDNSVKKVKAMRSKRS
ncbi:DUF6157 family protein [Chryseobacterium sp.]|uniref:DUF6157 family protein n=1 Tax=Chryseobacterium sp. TaxID=1871047 RepID=UPI00289A7BF4|nr:DUF6157 family protein [Chryseobacterium sp.]